MTRLDKGPPCVGLSEMQAFVRVESGEEEALLAGHVRTSIELCEAFINQLLIEREFEQDLTSVAGWTLIGVQPVRTVLSVTLTSAAEALPPDAYEVDIDHAGRAYLKGLAAGQKITVAGLAGMARDSNEVPEPLRQGIVRMAAFLFANRDSAQGELPGAVTALWRPYRRAGLCQ